MSENWPLTATPKNAGIQYILVILLKTSSSTYIVQSSLMIVYTSASQTVSWKYDEFEKFFQIWYKKFDQPQGESGFNKKKYFLYVY